MTARWNTIVSLCLGVLVAALFIAALAASDAPLAARSTASFIALAAIGLAT